MNPLSSNHVRSVTVERTLKSVGARINDLEMVRRVGKVVGLTLSIAAEASRASRSVRAVVVIGNVAGFIVSGILAADLVNRVKEWAYDGKEWSKNAYRTATHVACTVASVFDGIEFGYFLTSALKETGAIRGAVSLGGAAVVGALGSGFWIPVYIVSLIDRVKLLKAQKLGIAKLQSAVHFAEDLHKSIKEDENSNKVQDKETLKTSSLHILTLKKDLELLKRAHVRNVASIVFEVAGTVLSILTVVGIAAGVSALTGGIPILVITSLYVCAGLTKASMRLHEKRREQKLTLDIQNATDNIASEKSTDSIATETENSL